MRIYRGLSLIFSGILFFFATGLHAFTRYENTNHFISFLQERDAPVITIFPGAGIDARRYELLAEEILRKEPSFNVVIMKFTGNYPNPLEGKSRVEEMLRHLSARGFNHPKDHVFLAGHSLGGVFAHSLVPEMNLAGLILLGSYLTQSTVFNSPYTMATYPRPILNLSGELDGRVDLLYQARELSALKPWISSHPHDFSHMVVTLPGVNHMAFADGHVMNDDLKAEFSLPTMHEEIANVIGLFVRASKRLDMSAAEIGHIETYQQETYHIMKSVLDVKEMTENVCSDAQQQISALGNEEWAKIDIDSHRHRSFPAFVWDKAKAQVEDQTLNLYLPFYVEVPPNPMDISGTQLGQPVTVACKMRSQESIQKALGKEYAPSEVDCADLNRKIVDQVFQDLTDAQKNRFEASLPIVEHRSVRLASGVQWLSKSFRLFKDKSKGVWIFETPELLTSLDTKPQAFAGAHYCKVVAPERALQWLTRDVLLP